LLFAAGYVAGERGVVDLHNYEARTKYFPFLYREELNPFKHIWKNKSLYKMPRVDFLSYPERTGGTVDYVLLWGLREDQRGSEDVHSTMEQLRDGYELIHESERKWMKLFRRKNFDAERNGTP
jgi:hypothetical protein